VIVPIYENYKGYRPPWDARSTIAKLFSALPNRYLSGLQSVVLTNAAAIGRGKTQRVNGKKHLRQSCLGFYHRKRNGEQPWIEIVVGNAISAFRVPRVLMRVPLLRNIVLADTLFHEIGHHLDDTIGARARSGEAAAEGWQGRLIVFYFRKKYWYLMPVVRIAKWLFDRVIRKHLAIPKAR
jgi:hypothetical protein